jgi:four helix bundle protein
VASQRPDLVAWRVADNLRVVVVTVTTLPSFASDAKFRRQVEDAADTVCREIAEGVACQSDLDFARSLELARRSLDDLLDAMNSAASKRFVTIDDTRPIHTLARRLYPALADLMTSLRAPLAPARAASGEPPHQSRRRR